MSPCVHIVSRTPYSACVLFRDNLLLKSIEEIKKGPTGEKLGKDDAFLRLFSAFLAFFTCATDYKVMAPCGSSKYYLSLVPQLPSVSFSLPPSLVDTIQIERERATSLTCVGLRFSCFAHPPSTSADALLSLQL